MAADLRQQFELLQEQKKQKLLRRNDKMRQSSKSNSAQGINKSQNYTEPDYTDSLQLDDNLKLEDIFNNQLALQDNSDSEDMGETIRELKDENGRLHKLLGEKDEEMKIFKRRWQNEKKDLTGQNIGSENVAQKIIELSKKNRELNVEVESGKTKCRQMQNEVNKLETKLRKLSAKPKQFSKAEEEGSDGSKNVNKVAELEGKVTQLTSKVFEYRNQVESQKKELKIAHKVLTNEIGEDVDIQKLLNSESNWRGRQQQILNLQNKVSDLQRKLVQSTRSSSRDGNMSALSAMSYQSPLATSMHDEKIRLTIKKIEQERKDNQQKLQVELEVLQKEYTRLKEKHDAAKTRSQVLSKELKSAKAQVNTLTEKGKHDDELVSALLREQEYLKNLNVKLSKEKEEMESHSNSRVIKVKQDLEINEELKRQIEEQENKVRDLENELESLKQIKLREKERAKNDDLEQRPISKSKPSFIPTPPTSADRRNGYVNRFRRATSASSETDTSKLQEIRTMLQAVEVERDRLIELVDVLQKRLDSAGEEYILRENKVIELRKTNVKLEKQVERLRVSNKLQTGSVKNRPTSRAGKKSTKEKSAEEMLEELEELRARLEIQIDENEAIKDALESTLRAKNEDLKIYQEMAEQTKYIYLQGLKQIKQAASS
ncbi:coiled-coil domain-containing protein 13-like [Rhopilema esculentum]|uniref:coiled-coil domain-containing protein 13-like n=1 Tax=Rhopilema esculentum TaxID=499914 RepID=UPI0031D532F9